MAGSGKIIPIRIYGDPVLRKKTDPVAEIDGSIDKLITDMTGALNSARGLGLAAPQVGHSRSLCIINLPIINEKVKEPLVLINPVIKEREDEVIYEEGCLSFPGIFAEVARPRKVSVTGLDRNGKPVEYEVSDIMARVFLHEIDHLNGVLFIDHLSTVKRQLLKGRLKKLSQGV